MELEIEVVDGDFTFVIKLDTIPNHGLITGC